MLSSLHFYEFQETNRKNEASAMGEYPKRRILKSEWITPDVLVRKMQLLQRL